MINLLWQVQKDPNKSDFLKEERELVDEADTVELTNFIRSVVYEEKLRLGYNVHRLAW